MTDLQTQDESTPQFAQVAVPVHLQKLFTYKLPPLMQRSARVGSRVMVQLGTKSTPAYIVALLPRLREGTSLVESELKEVQELLDVDPPLTAEVLEITRWVADYYAAPWGEVMRAALPAGLNASVEQTIVITDRGRAAIESPQLADTPPNRGLTLLANEGEVELNALMVRMGVTRTPKWLRELESDGLIERGYRTIASAARAKRRRAVRLDQNELPNGRAEEAPIQRTTAAQQRALDALKSAGGELSVVELVERASISESVIKTLLRNRLVTEFEEEVRRDPLAHAKLPPADSFVLTDAQTMALSLIEDALKARAFSPTLLHGVTGSGKTEIYIRAMYRALEMDRGAMMLVPEIALTPILSRRLRAHFGEEIAIFHSSLSKGERFDEWSRLRAGEARIVLGTRSAVFAPVKELGLIIIDEEQDSSYRQEESPFYSARDAAIVRAQKESAVVVLGSATPSLESFHNAHTGKYEYVQLPDRIANRPLARAVVVDMREVFARRRKPTVFSDELLEAIDATHSRKEQTIILLNRRGYSSFILCRSCGNSIECPNCDVTLTYHRGDQTLVCHYCNHHQRAPTVCPSCGSKYIYYVGEGTEQVEELLRKRFPRMRLGRIDRDTKARRREFE